MKNKTITLSMIITLVMFSSIGYAQEIQRSYYGNGGNAVHSGSITLSQTIGEPLSQVFEYYDNDSAKYYLLRQGFEQNIKDTIIYTYLFNDEVLNIEIYPNPTHDYLNIKLNIDASEKLMLAIYDDKGSMIRIERVNSSNNTIDVSKLSQGIYFIRLENSSTKLKINFPFIKI